ncbi:MAG: nucleoside hydrolase [Alphaproteobacteria bacterium]|nr:MAG: nucleoside hydrolase [Alphaproteobacteria bacterium]
MPRPIIIDTDPGTDDAVAILLALAAPEVEVMGLVAVAGNLPLAMTERNARSVLELAGRPEIPVYAGCPRPMSPGLVAAVHVHGEGGLGQLELPPPRAVLARGHGVDFLIETLREAAPRSVKVCVLGPLTNIATALVKAPEIAGRMAELVVMGGASYALGNTTPAAEFNMHADPFAAALVFDSSAPITMIPLDLTHQVLSTPERIERVRALGNRCGEAAAMLMEPPPARRGRGRRPTYALHDPCVIAYLLAPELFEGGEVNVAIETQSPLTLGMTVVDWRGISGRRPNARVMTRIDADGFYTLLTERLAGLP